MTLGKFDRKRGVCDGCNKRRMVTKCPCPVCQRESNIQLCEDCERAQLQECLDDENKHGKFSFEIETVSCAYTNDITVTDVGVDGENRIVWKNGKKV